MKKIKILSVALFLLMTQMSFGQSAEEIISIILKIQGALRIGGNWRE